MEVLKSQKRKEKKKKKKKTTTTTTKKKTQKKASFVLFLGLAVHLVFHKFYFFVFLN